MSTEMPKPNATETHVPAVEAEGGLREATFAAHAAEQERREAFVREGGVIVEEPGILNQEPGEAQGDRETAEARESARRERFFADLVAKFPELTEVQHVAVRAAMEREKTRTWSDYDGENTTIKRISIEGNVLTIVFDIEDMYMCVDVKVAF